MEACDRPIRANTLWQVIKFVNNGFLSCANGGGPLVYLNKLVLLVSLLKFSALHQIFFFLTSTSSWYQIADSTDSIDDNHHNAIMLMPEMCHRRIS